MIRIERLYWLIFICVILIFLDIMGLLALVHKILPNIVLPVKKSVYSTSLAATSFNKVIFQYPQIVKITEEQDKLKKEKEEAQLANLLLKEENLKLRQQLEAPLPPTFKFIPAQVISVSRKMELSAGEAEGVKVGMVVVDGATLIGKVDWVKEGRSTALLLNDTDSRVWAKTSKDARGIVVGQAGAMVILEKVLQKDPLFLGDQVTTSGEGGFPPHLLIGEIVHIKSEDVSPYKEAKIETPLVFNQLKTVFIISSP